MSLSSTCFSLLFLAATWIFPAITEAGDGRIEINQASIEAAGGFPYTISEPGSYVLTGSLAVPADTGGIVIDTGNVTLDLNGFSISGPFVCQPGDCPGGSADGIGTNGQQDYVTVRNGTVSGFSGNCISLFRHARVERMQITQCGFDGIRVSSHGSVFYNQVFNVGDTGIFMAGDSGVLGHNTVSQASVGAGNDPAIQGEKETAGNFCDDGGCGWVDTRRRFYLTQTTHQGDSALTACANGFHMASLWEILEVTQLRYDTDLGATSDDSGLGPPNAAVGWIRTGYGSSTSNEMGRANCNAWQSNLDGDFGTTVYLPEFWSPGFWDTYGTFVSPWVPGAVACDITFFGVWCVED